MKKLFITDLDHTLLRNDRSISRFTIDILNELVATSYFSIATARSFYSSSDIAKQIDINTPMILLDGALVATKDKKIIDICTIDKATADMIINEGARLGIYPFIIALNDEKSMDESFIIPTQLNANQKKVLINYKNDPRVLYEDDIRARDINIKLVYFGTQEELELLDAHLQGIFGDTLEFKLSPEKYFGGYFLTILHTQGDKAHALKKVCEYHDIDFKDLTVFGDSINDIAMFELAGTSVAVANALDIVKSKANIILPHTNDEDGVAKYLSKKTIS
ncbi:MAG: HAD family hydrolase [Campylobacterales bacterium]|nr:HAD family hydrolase [Campylobacterales bacterium]